MILAGIREALMGEILTLIVYAFGMFTVGLTFMTLGVFVVARLSHAFGILHDDDNRTIVQQILNNFN